MSVRKIKNSWWVDISFNDRRYRKRSPENSRAGAKLFESQLRRKLVIGEPIEDRKRIIIPTYQEYAWKWFEVYVKGGKKKPSVVDHYRNILKRHIIPYFGKTEINKISNLQIEEFKSKKLKAGLANRSINNYLIVLSKSLRVAMEWHNLKKMPKIEWLKNPPIKNDYLTDDECANLLKVVNGIWKDIIHLLLKTGLRLGEFRVLRWEDINWDTRTLTVERAMSGGVLGSTKSNRTRYIPLHDDIYYRLKDRRKESGYIFPNENGDPYGQHYYYNHLKKICSKAGTRRVGWHLFRHTFASNLAMAGAPVIAIKELLGHSDIQTTMRYAHLGYSALANTISLLKTGENRNLRQYSGNHANTGKHGVNIFLPNIKQKQAPKDAVSMSG